MQLSCRWLKRYCEFDLTPQEVSRLLTGVGLEVEGIETVGGDAVLSAEVTTNRPDWLSHIGVARDISALLGLPLRIPQIQLQVSGPDASQLTSVEVQAPDLCPRYTARVITGVKIKTSPDWLVEALESLGLHSVNNVVDVTNFVLLECGQPLHAFDYDRLKERRIVVRRARSGEKLEAIDGSKQELTENILVIADAHDAVAIAGVMGGLATEVTDRTTTVLLESARFAPVNIRRTSRTLGLTSDAGYRFERGIDPEGVDWASRRAAQLIAELTGGKVAPGMADVSFEKCEPWTVSLRPARYERIMGISIEADRVCEILEGLGLTATTRSTEHVTFQVPSWRLDLTREIDLIEEIARIEGYERVPAGTHLSLGMSRSDHFARVRQRVAEVLSAAGYDETVTLSLQDQASCHHFHPFNDGAVLKLANPLNEEVQYPRLSLLPALLRARKTNEDRRHRDVRLWELAGVYLPTQDDPEKIPQELQVVGVLSDEDFGSVKGVVEAIARVLRVADRLTFEPEGPQFLEVSRSAVVLVDGQPIGYVGVVSAESRARFALKTPVVAAELNFHALETAAQLESRYVPLPRFPEVTRDLAIVVDEPVTWSKVLSVVRDASPATLEAVQFMSEFRGKQITTGKKSVAFGMTFRAPDRTLTSDEVDAALEKVLAALTRECGATLRGA